MLVIRCYSMNVHCATVLAEPLSMIFQQSFETGTLPADWKTANIVPIFKKRDRTDRANYRPVSITSVLCKIMESIIKEKSTKFFRFTSGTLQRATWLQSWRSCVTNLLETLENWTKALDEGFGLDIVYLDYRKAPDSVRHRRLIEKLKSFGINGKLLRGWRVSLHQEQWVLCWGEVFLTDSEGIDPQGSVLGPLLFLLFVNELSSGL